MRLSAITRRFPTALILGSFGGLLRDYPAFKERIDTSFMADLAEAMLPKGTARLIADEETLPLAPASLDLIVSLWGLHHVNDLPGALVQIRQALKPDGLFLAALPGGHTLDTLRNALLHAETEISGGIGAHIHPFIALPDLAHLMQRAQFALPVADIDTLTVNYADPHSLFADLRGMGDTNILTDRARILRRDVLARAWELCKENGKTPIRFDLCYLTGWAHHESQQKPLAPGSATTRLADALKTTEHKI